MPNNILKELFFCQKSYGNTTRLKILNTIKKNSVPFHAISVIYSQAKQELRGTISGHFRRFTPRPNKSSVATSRYVTNTFFGHHFFFNICQFFYHHFFDHHFFSIFFEVLFFTPAYFYSTFFVFLTPVLYSFRRVIYG